MIRANDPMEINMNILKTLALLLVPFAVSAGPYDGMPGGNPFAGMDMQKMQQMAAEMQACMQNIDQGALEKLKQRGETMEREIKSLCKSGQRDKAMDQAMAYAKEISQDPEIGKLKKCSEKVQAMMPATQQFAKYDEDNMKSHHVCDQFK